MSKRKARRERRLKQQRRQRMITVLVIVGIALVFVGILVKSSSKRATTIITPPARNLPSPAANALGDPNAPVVIDEYSDFQCPYCRMFFEDSEQQIIDTYVATGKVYFVYHTMGGMIGPESLAAAEAAYCAGDQNKFWEYHDILFTNQNGENIGTFSNKMLQTFGEKLQLDMPTFKDCLSSHTYRSKAQQDQVDGRQGGVKATPSFLINGQLLEGAQPFNVFQQAIETALAASGQ